MIEIEEFYCHSKKKKNRFHEISFTKKPKKQVKPVKIASNEVQIDEKFAKKKMKNCKNKKNSPTILSQPKELC